ncbi:MAG TPA: hypothetical protein VFV49_10380 [Thermoanaerobaculia bacterium]|nr:hypothetical protein [Thermoanaerobaculia bacterium]
MRRHASHSASALRVPRHFMRLLLFPLLLCATVIQSAPRAGSVQSSPQSSPQSPPQSSPQSFPQWFTVNQDYSSQRYVDLDQIRPRNVGTLKKICQLGLNTVRWNGEPRTKPPRSHTEFVRAFREWVDAGGECPPF